MHLMTSHRPTKFGGHRHYGSRDIMVFVCPVILEDQVANGSFDFMGESPTW